MTQAYQDEYKMFRDAMLRMNGIEPARKAYVLTGGPCCGKTSIIEMLQSNHYCTIDEVACWIIVEERIRGSDRLPWKNKLAFQDAVLQEQLLREARIPNNTPCYIDRGLPDGIAYLRAAGIEVPRRYTTYAAGRYDLVFLMQPLPHYQRTNDRHEDEAGARRLHDEIVKVYAEFGYETIEVPVLDTDENKSKEKRLAFILQKVAEHEESSRGVGEGDDNGTDIQSVQASCARD